MLGAIFIASGARALVDSERLAIRAKPVTDRIAPLLERTDRRLPTEAKSLVQVNGAVQVASGLLLATGHATRPAAAVLAGSMVPTTLAGHPFWQEQDAATRRDQQLHFFKNVGLMGGLLLAAVDTEGRPGLRWRTAHAIRTAKREARLARRAAAFGRRIGG